MTAGIVWAYMLAMLGIGFYLRGRIQSTSDFLLAGRKLGLVLTTATLAAVQIGAGVVLGGAELGAEGGVWPGTWYGMGCGGGLILAGLLVAPKLRGRGAYVPLDFFAERYGENKWVRIWAWLSNIPSLLGVFVAQIMACGSVFTLFGLSYRQGVLISGIVTMTYTVAGGMWGVAVTDLIQVGIIFVGIPLVAWAAVDRLQGAGLSIATLLRSDFIPQGMETRAVFIILPFLLSISVSYDAFMRYQSARSDRVARWGCVLGGILVVAISVCVGLAGAIGKALYPQLENGEVLPHMIQSVLSPVQAGLVLAAILAAAMSPSLLVSLAGCFSRDLYNKVLNPERSLDELEHSKAIVRAAIGGATLIGIWIALHAKGILYTMILFNYPYMGSMLVPLLGGVLWKRATRQAALSAMVLGGLVGVASFLTGVPGPFQGWFNVDLGLLAAYGVSAAGFVGVTLTTPRPKAASA